jgi:hypothetical protein
MQEPNFVSSVFHATDFSDASYLAFAHALAVALLRETDLTILHAGRDFLAEDEWTKFPAVRRTLESWGCLEPGSPRSAVLEQLNVRVKKVNLRSLRPAAAIHAMSPSTRSIWSCSPPRAARGCPPGSSPRWRRAWRASRSS